MDVTTAILWLAQAPASEETAADPSSGPAIVIGLALITLAGTAVTAFAPQIPEIIKARLGRGGNGAVATAESPTGVLPAAAPESAPPASSNQMVQSANAGLSMVEDAVLDYRSQRDAAMGRYDEVREDLEEAKDVIREQAVYIAQLEGWLGIGRQNYGGRHGPQPDASQQGHYR